MIMIKIQGRGTDYAYHIKTICFIVGYVQPIVQINCLKTTSTNQSSHYENYGRFLLQMEVTMCLPQNQHFVVSKDEWGTKEGTLMKNVLYMYNGMAKGISQAEATSNSEKSSP